MTENTQRPQKDSLIKSLTGLSNLAPTKPALTPVQDKPATSNESQKK